MRRPRPRPRPRGARGSDGRSGRPSVPRPSSFSAPGSLDGEAADSASGPSTSRSAPGARPAAPMAGSSSTSRSPDAPSASGAPARVTSPRVPAPGRTPAGSAGASGLGGATEADGLERDLDHAIAGGRWSLVAELRAKVVEADPESVKGAEAAFKLGLHNLYVREVEAAEAALRTAVRAGQPPWSRSARVSLAQLLLRTGRAQQAAFELRKAIAESPEDLVAAQARAFLVDAMRARGQNKEAEALRLEHKAALARLASAGGVDGALAHAWLGFEHKHDGERKPAKAALSAALASGVLPEAERISVERALEAL